MGIYFWRRHQGQVNNELLENHFIDLESLTKPGIMTSDIWCGLLQRIIKIIRNDKHAIIRDVQNAPSQPRSYPSRSKVVTDLMIF